MALFFIYFINAPHSPIPIDSLHFRVHEIVFGVAIAARADQKYGPFFNGCRQEEAVSDLEFAGPFVHCGFAVSPNDDRRGQLAGISLQRAHNVKWGRRIGIGIGFLGNLS